jgi:3-oxoadipate enol-lactonase
VLLLHPDGSPFIPLSVVTGLHERLPDAELQVFAHAKHDLPFSHGRECAATLRRFLERRVVGTRG